MHDRKLDDALAIGLIFAAGFLIAAALAGSLFAGCAAVPPPEPSVMPPVSAMDAGAPISADPGCAVLCSRCPQLGPDGGDCTQACGNTLEAVDSMLDPQCVRDAVDCDAALACVR
jgi:hypothetical protein